MDGAYFLHIFTRLVKYYRLGMVGKLKTVVCATMVIAISACGQSSKTTVLSSNSKKEYATLLNAYQQTTLPGRPVPGSEPSTEHRFIIVWKNNTKPETFFWKSNDIWAPCQVSKVNNYHPENINDKDLYNKGYSAKEISLFKISANDTLELIPIFGSKNPIPDNLPQTNNAIFYKATKTDWLTLPVDKTTELPDIIMQ